MKPCSCILLFLLFVPQMGFTQVPTQTIRGAITDADSRQPLSGATVLLLELDKGTVTDSAGRYRLEVKPLNEQAGSGSYTLAIQKLAGTPSKAPRHRAGAHQG